MNLQGLPPIEEPALIGVSGGRDSVALLHVLRARGFEKLVVCHLDHGLRTESAEDARFVAQLAEECGCEAVSGRQDVAARAKRRRQSVETAGREARYEFFAQTARNRGCARLFLAHHADDQVETFLFNLFRGAGTSGLAAMREVSNRTIGGVELKIVRPLLGVWREEIDAYIARHELPFREDLSNTNPRHARNRMRHEIIPLLEKSFGREIRRAVWRTAEILRGEEELLTGTAAAEVVGERLSVPALRAMPLAIQRRVIHAWLRTQRVADIDFASVEAVRALLHERRAKCNLPGSQHARRRGREIFIE